MSLLKSPPPYLIHAPNLRDADLRGANLSRADLRCLLPSANLSGANLCSTYLPSANLSGANLSGAGLRDADLSEVDIRSANLQSADLSRVNLSGARVENALLSNALGLSEEIKHDLQSRGAIFEDISGDRFSLSYLSLQL